MVAQAIAKPIAPVAVNDAALLERIILRMHNSADAKARAARYLLPRRDGDRFRKRPLEERSPPHARR